MQNPEMLSLFLHNDFAQNKNVRLCNTKHPVLNNQMNPTWRIQVWSSTQKDSPQLFFHGSTIGLLVSIQLFLALKGIFQGW